MSSYLARLSFFRGVSCVSARGVLHRTGRHNDAAADLADGERVPVEQDRVGAQPEEFVQRGDRLQAEPAPCGSAWG